MAAVVKDFFMTSKSVCVLCKCRLKLVQKKLFFTFLQQLVLFEFLYSGWMIHSCTRVWVTSGFGCPRLQAWASYTKHQSPFLPPSTSLLLRSHSCYHTSRSFFCLSSANTTVTERQLSLKKDLLHLWALTEKQKSTLTCRCWHIQAHADQGALVVEASASHRASATGVMDACIDWLAAFAAALPSSCGFIKDRRMRCNKIFAGWLGLNGKFSKTLPLKDGKPCKK